MKLGKKKSKTQLPGSRQVVRGGRAQAFSYRASRNDQEFKTGRQQPREQDVRRRERIIRYWRQRLGMFIAGVVLIICVLYTLHLNSQPKVVSLTPTSQSAFLQSTDVYQKAAAAAFEDSLFNSNKVTVNAVAIQQKLQRQFPELSEVSVTIPLMSHRAVVYVAPTTPSLILSGATGEYILDENGKALLTSSQVSEVASLGLPVINDQSGLNVKPGAIALAGSEVSFIQTVLVEMKAKGIEIESMTLPGKAYQLDVKPKGVGYYVKFNMHEDTARQQSGTFLAVRERLGSQGIKPATYIDVRLDGRAYYK